MCGNGLCEQSETHSTCPADCACSSHSQCGRPEICLDGRCESALNRVYKITVLNAVLDYNSHTADADQSNPDPFVTVHFPDSQTTVMETSTKNDTLNPVWNEYVEVTPTAVGQEVSFCVWDRDLLSDDPMYFGDTTNCAGFGYIIDFIRTGPATVRMMAPATAAGTRDVLSLDVKIAPK